MSRIAVLARLVFLFIIVPLVELALLLQLGDLIGWQLTLLLVVVTGAVGIWLARTQGLLTYRRIQSALSEGRVPTDSLLDAVLILVAGALLLTPGVLTDAFGLSLLVPPCRRLYRTRLVRWFKTRVSIHYRSFGSQASDADRSEVIDSYVVDRPPEEKEEEEE